MALWDFSDTDALEWFDFADTDTIVHGTEVSSTEGDVTQVDSKSGSGNSAVQAIGSSRPTTGSETLNGLNALKSSGDFLSLSERLVGVRSAVIAMKGSSSGLATPIYAEEQGGSVSYAFILRDGGYTVSIDGNKGDTGSAAVNGGAKVAGGDIDLGLSTAQKQQPFQIYIEMDSPVIVDWLMKFQSVVSDGTYYEMVFFDRPLSDEDYFYATGRIAHKWGLTGSLPSGHPYKVLPPLEQPYWSPDLINTTRWYDASDTDTITESSGAVSQLDDKSGLDLHATQNTSADQPATGQDSINGLNTITADGSNDILKTTVFPASCSIFFVVKADTADASQSLICGGSVSAFLPIGQPTTNPEIYRNVGTPDLYKNSVLQTPSTRQDAYDAFVDDQTNIVYFEGLDGSNLSSLFGTGSFKLEGQFCEMVAIEGTLSDETRQIIEGYLAHKWGLTGSLPVGHPYKLEAPLEQEYFDILSLSPADWFDASDTSTITHDASVSATEGNVSAWASKTDSGNTADQPNATRQPITGLNILNGLNVLSFDRDYFDLAIAMNNMRSMLFVADRLQGSNVNTTVSPITGGAGSHHTFVRTNGTDFTISIDGNGTFSGRASANGGALVAGGNVDLGLSIAEKEAPLQFYAEYDQDSLVDSLFSLINDQQFLIGRIGTVILFDRFLTQDEYFKATGILAHQWGLTANLPVDHPYKVFPPLVDINLLDSIYSKTISSIVGKIIQKPI